ncbi:MAG: DUF4145 domain-containing protein [Phormidesmis sp. CAN_BIN44]|nr:DUF4145 domain-containing protein [Phormidesmis sp. CAN_BIN44]
MAEVAFKTMIVDCKDCDARVDGRVIGSYEYHDKGQSPPTRITLLQCSRCQHPILSREEELWSNSWSKPETVYPCEGDTLNPNLPEEIQATIREARSCFFHARAYAATAIMCRKALDGLCTIHNITAPNLDKKLNKLKEQGLIEGSLFEWANELRLIGNEAAHDITSQISGEDARDLLEFTEAIVDYVIVFRDRFERFKNRRTIQKKT